MKKTLPILFVLLCSLTGMGFEKLSGVSIQPDGSLKFGGGRLGISIADTAWRFIGNQDWQDWQEETVSDSRCFSGRITVDGTPGRIREELRRSGPNRLTFLGNVEFDTPVTCNSVSAAFSVPFPVAGLRVNGKKITIPEVPGDQVIFAEAPAKKLVVELPGGKSIEFSGKFTAYVQDSRRWSNSMSVRLGFEPARGTIRKAAVKFDVAFGAPNAFPVDLKSVANRTLYDRDGQGWTGQGEKNDMGALESGTYSVSEIPFRIAEGKSCIVIGRTAPAKISLPLPKIFRGGAINLMHASAFTPRTGQVIGFLDFSWPDGRKTEVPVRAGVDCDNWHLTMSRPNAVIAVRRQNPTATVGLYVSSFPLPKNPPSSVTFRIADKNAFWMIAAVTLSDRNIHFSVSDEKPVTMAAGKDWRPYRFERRIIPGSPLDFSGLQEAPAGKFGFLKATPAGDFAFENRPGKKVRFFGVNLCFAANFPDRKTAREMADQLTMLGYNTVRFHHHDDSLSDRKSTSSDVLDPDNLDRLDYLFAEMKARGIYIVTDLYTSRRFQSGDSLIKSEYQKKAWMKSLLAIDRGAMENWKKFARAWMEHVNPYTGLAWGKDPALICLNLVNEEPLVNYWAATPEIAKRYREKFKEWKKQHNGSDTDFRRFLHELQAAVLDEQLDFVKKELGLKTLITSLNCNFTESLTLLRDKFDVVDNHQYFAHPMFPEKAWTLPFRIDQSSPIVRNAIMPRLLMPTRIFGKPFIVTEFNYCNPNVFRAAGGPLFGTYAAMQDWDGLWRFAWSQVDFTLNKPLDGAAFDAVNDPMQQFSDRIIHSLFIRGDFASAAEKISIEISTDPRSKAVFKEFPDSFSTLGLNAQIGSRPAGQKLPPGVKNYRPGMTVPPDPRVKLDPSQGTFSVATPLTEAVVLPAGDLAAKLLRVRDADTFMCVAATSLDGLPLATSKSVLLIHLTNFSAVGTRFDNAAKTLLRQWGTWPHLIERGIATVELSGTGDWRVAALYSDGSEAGVVKTDSGNDTSSFRIDTFAFPGGISAYHLTR